MIPYLEISDDNGRRIIVLLNFGLAPARAMAIGRIDIADLVSHGS